MKTSLSNTLQELTPAFEKALQYSPATASLGESLQLRTSQCGLATAALQFYLQEQHAITTDRLMIEAEKAPRTPNRRRQSHAVLYSDSTNEVIDPTHGQFMSHIGLTPRVAQQHGLEHQYPASKIAVYSADASADFANSFTQHIYETDHFRPIKPAELEVAPVGSLRGASFEQFEEVYEELWDIKNYDEFPLQEQHPDLQLSAVAIARAIR